MPAELRPRPLAVNMPIYAVRHKQIGGTEFGIYSLVKGLAQTDARLSVTYGRDEDLSPEFLIWLRQQTGIRVQRRGGVPGPKNARFLEEILFGLRPTDDDWLVFPNYFAPPPRPFEKRRRCVILHDIQYKVYPQYHSSKRRAWLDMYLPRMFRFADVVMLVSNSELELVREHFGAEAAAKCDVVPNAVDWTRLQPTDGELPPDVQARLNHRYILSVCYLYPHKNVGTLLQAFADVARQDPDVRLYLVGTLSEKNLAFVRSSVPENLIDRVQILGFVDDRSLGAYYAHASLFALPSLYEGFGVPAVEAMGFGIPTLVSGCSALPEVTLGEAQYVGDPLDPGEWSARILAALAAPSRPSPQVAEQIRGRYTAAAVGNALLETLRKRS